MSYDDILAMQVKLAKAGRDPSRNKSDVAYVKRARRQMKEFKKGPRTFVLSHCTEGHFFLVSIKFDGDTKDIYKKFVATILYDIPRGVGPSHLHPTLEDFW